MGEHTARWEAAAPRTRDGGTPAVFEMEVEASTHGGTYRAQIAWPEPIVARRVAIQSLVPDGLLRLSRLSLHDEAAGASCPLTLIHTLLTRSGRWEPVYSNGMVDLLRNRHALPRAWLVPRTLALPAEAVVLTLQFGRLPDGEAFDPRAVALVENAPGREFGHLDPAAEVRVTAYEPNAIELHSRSRTPAFLVLSEIFYPGWRAEIDGVAARIVRTNYALRGLFLPAGEHRVSFAYRPRSVGLGLAITGGTAFALAVVAVVRSRRRGGIGGRG